jgi:hypothetical protein
MATNSEEITVQWFDGPGLARNRLMAHAFCMAHHRRLGASAPCNVLPPEITERVFQNMEMNTQTVARDSMWLDWPNVEKNDIVKIFFTDNSSEIAKVIWTNGFGGFMDCLVRTREAIPRCLVVPRHHVLRFHPGMAHQTL